MEDFKTKKKKSESKNDLVDNMYHDMSDDEEFPTDFDRNTAGTWFHRLLLNRPLKAVLAMVVVAVVIPTLLYAFMYGVSSPEEPFGTCVILPEYWSECMPGNPPTKKSQCENAKCCWNSTLSYCYHTLPSQHTYKLVEKTTNVEDIPVKMSPRQKKTPLGLSSYDDLTMHVYALEKAHAVLELTIEDSDNVPNNTIPMKESSIEANLNSKDGFWLKMYHRNSIREVLFTTENGPLIASNGSWEISLQFPTDAAVLGAGSAARASLKLSPGNASLYSGYSEATNGRPFLLCLHSSNQSHGVLFESPGALEVVTRSSNLVTIRSTAMNILKLHIFTGDSPAQVIENLTSYIGRPKILPSWALGLHICRDAARNETTNYVTKFMEDAEKINLPYDSDCIDDSALGINSLNLEIERIENLKNDINTLIKHNRRFMFSLFPQVANGSVAFEKILELNLLLNFNESEPFLGLHRDFLVGYPDYSEGQAANWLEEQLKLIFNVNEISIPSGFALPDNWPLNENELQDDGDEKPIYIPEGLEGSLSNGTVWWMAQHVDGSLHHTRHAEYGAEHTRAALQALMALHQDKKERLPVFTASKWTPNSGGYWLGNDQPATWEGFKGALLTVLEAGLSGEPLTGGGSICGSRDEWNESLCTRWSILAMAAFPIVRYHHVWDHPPRDPTAMTESSAGLIARATRLRYQMLPYMYTQMYYSTQTGMPVTRPLAFDFYSDNTTWALDEQIMVGAALMLAPVLKPADVVVKVYLPLPATPWYHLLDGERVDIPGNTGEVTLLASENELVMLQRGGHVIVMQEEDNSTFVTQYGMMRFYVALDCNETDGECYAQGELYIDDGINIDSTSALVQITANSTSVIIAKLDEETFQGQDCTIPELGLQFTVQDFAIYGVTSFIEGSVTMNSDTIIDDFVDYNENYQRLRITGLGEDWCLGKEIELSWEI